MQRGRPSTEPSLPDIAHWKRLSPQLDTLLDLDGAGRAAYLAQLAQQDPALAAELDALLREGEHLRESSFLCGRASTSADAPALGLTGVSLGGYTLEVPIGQGGSGSVWRARRSDGRYDGHAAIKLLHLSLIGHAAAERFQREGAILARLNHPHIAALFDAGVTPGGQPYLVIELVEGLAIDVHCARARLDVEGRLRLFCAVLSAVGHAHRHLVVHRDIKPGNVFVTTAGQVKLLDFGIAKLLDNSERGAEATALTRDGGRPLTPEYAAPEQFGQGEVSTATDIYSLGVLLYRLLCGRHPTSGHGGSTDARHAVLHTEPTRMSRAVTLTTGASSPDLLANERASTMPRLSRRLAGDLDTIVAHMLRKRPAERYPTVDAVADDIRRHLAHEPISVRPDGWAYRAAKFTRRHRGAVLATGLTGLAIAAGVFGTISQAQRALGQAQIAQVERDRALRELDQAEAAKEFLGQLMRARWNRPRSTSELLADAEELLQRQFANEHGLRARMQASLIDLYVEMNEGRRSQTLGKQAADSATAAGDPVSRAIVQCAQALARVDGLDTAGARRLYDEALAVLRPRRETEAAALANCLVGRSHVESLHGEDARAALDFADEALPLLPPQRSSLRSLRHYAILARADALEELGRSAEAVVIYESVAAEQTQLGTSRSIVGAFRLGRLASILDLAGQPRRAAEAQAASNAIDAELRGEGGLPAVSLGNHARLLLQLGDAAGARTQFERALAKAHRDNEPALVGIVSLNYARLWCDAGDLRRCADLVATGHRLLDPLLGPGHPRRANILSVDAMLAEARGDLPGARVALLEALRLLAATPTGKSLRQGLGWRLARVELGLGQLDDAGSRADAAVTQAREALGGFRHSLPLGQALLLRGQVHAVKGETAAARRAYAEAIEQLRSSAGDAAPPLRAAERALAALDGPRG